VPYARAAVRTSGASEWDAGEGKRGQGDERSCKCSCGGSHSELILRHGRELDGREEIGARSARPASGSCRTFSGWQERLRAEACVCLQSDPAQAPRAEGTVPGVAAGACATRRYRAFSLSSSDLHLIRLCEAKAGPDPNLRYFEMTTKIREKLRDKVTKVKDVLAQSLRPGATSRPSSRISTRPTTPIPTAESNLPIGTEENRLASAPIAAGEGAHEGPSGAFHLPATVTCDSRP
jgi:hypothetical protein